MGFIGGSLSRRIPKSFTKTSQIVGKKPSFRSAWRFSSLIFCFSGTTPPDVNERLPTRQENGIMESKPAMVPRRGGILPPRHKLTMSLPTLGTGNGSCLTATHKHGTHGSTLRVKNNIAAPTGKLHREFRTKNWNLASFLFLDVPQAHSFQI